mgnify:CR=1 FL=1|tara:strand:+ start:4356 stop:4877 length:522 start_codon:yes stop_codon:yes gene_type:complete
MSWKYYRKGKLVEECDNIPETMDDAVRELRENGVDVSDCVIDDNWSPDYPPEEAEYMDTLTFAPLTDEEVEKWEKTFQKLLKEGKALKVPHDFEEKLFDKIGSEKERSRINDEYDKMSSKFNKMPWWKKMTLGEKQYVSFWIIYLYLLLGLVVTQEPRIVGMVCEIILWPFFM